MSNLKAMRQKYNLTQMNIAKAIGVSINTITKWENNVSTPSEDNLKKLDNLFSTLRIERGE
nr:MAG TPA: Helix-turn-helix XRE-family like protein [Caudoviricetes sp.]